jgi:hypothetical protein
MFTPDFYISDKTTDREKQKSTDGLAHSLGCQIETADNIVTLKGVFSRSILTSKT